MISVSMPYEKQFQQVQGKRIAPDRIGKAVSHGLDLLEDGGAL